MRMKAVIIKKPGEVILEEVDGPKPFEGEVLLRVRYVGFCGSDLSSYLGRNQLVSYPRIPGHEISGVIAGKGEGVPGRFREGEAVTVIPYTHCGGCPACKRGRPNACRENQTLGVQRDGAMRELITVPWQKLLPAPKLNELELAVVEPLTVGFHAIGRGRVEASDTVMVQGCGMIGTGAILAALQRRARVIAVDVDERKLELAGTLGARHLLNPGKPDLHGELASLTGGDGPDVVVEAAGSPDSYRTALAEVAFTGRVVCIGYTGSEVPLNPGLFVKKEMDILGSRNAAVEDFQAVITFLEQGDFPLDRIITEKVKPEEAARAFERWAGDPGRTMKILLEFNP
jgi:L-galactonate 5-dehydrogenase